ncbi:IS110 family transposase [Streptomyces broussonetiae]|uniref:IS110 family transposase n=1 Tax=Streptomyces broussonetiae TaxID=2686304 RepID=A0A6I6MTA0_9ACTN|nr:IS110 family transposase [Streptomyces broussonetiae]QHA02214.1 IS110 family transposase [Streptomyces broussonetiae]
MVVLGIDAHKRNHTAVAADERGRELGTHTTGTTSSDHLRLLAWARRFGEHRLWAVEDCRQLSRRLEADLLAAGERIVRVPPKLMANCRKAARTYGKSDPIDALAVARAALREPDLPTAQLDGPSRELRLLVDYREDLVTERTRIINRMRWHLHELDPGLDPPARSLTHSRQVAVVEDRLRDSDGIVARLARRLLARCQALTDEIRELEKEITGRIETLAPNLLKIPGCGTLTAAKILGETADVTRFRSEAAFARHNGTAPLPVWSGNRARHRLSRTGNRQLNTALHRIAVTQAHYHPDARAYLQRRQNAGNTTTEAIRALKRHLSDVVYRALRRDARESHSNVITLATAA